jgi:glucan biosynthesis protein
MNLENPDLKKTVGVDNDLKNFIVEYSGEKMNNLDNNVTVEMVINVLSEDFPEVVLALAEENWVRGYQQGLDDVEAGRSMLEKQSVSQKNCKLCEKKQ